MFGKTRRQHAYYACQPDPHHHDGRARWYADHPASLWVREGTLLDLVHSFFAERLRGPGRRDLLRAQLAARADGEAGDARNARQGQLRKRISDLERRKKNLISKLEDYDDTGEAEIVQEFRQGIQRRFVELAAEQRASTEELTQAEATTPAPIGNDPDLLM
jgi:site-specific DNA recombinase